MSLCSYHIALAESQHYVINTANPRSALHDGVEHRLHVRRRAADNAEDFRSRRLMLQGFAQFCVAFLQFLEQTHILDGDDSLIGENLDEIDLAVRKWFDKVAPDGEDSDGCSFAQQRHG